MGEQEGGLTLRLIGTVGVPGTTLTCDALRLTVKDGTDGKGGGSLGIRRGHASALIVLDAGRLVARLGERTVYEAELPGGIAQVEKDLVTVLPAHTEKGTAS